MRRTIWLPALGALVFVFTLIWQAPLAAFADRNDLAQRGVLFERAQGTIWSGDLLGVALGGQPIGRVTLDLKPASLLTGEIAYDMDVAGPAGEGRGQLAFSPGGGIALRDLVADVNLQAIERLDTRLRQAPATVSVILPELIADRRMACRRADGRLQSDLLQRLGGQFSWTGPPMAGIIACDGEGGYQVTLANTGGEDEIALDAIGSPLTASYTADVRVRTNNEQVANTLLLMKFQKVDDQYVYSRVNGVVRSIGEAG
ncbi:MAG: type II secretion system protein N [Pseudomonadota bacterium]